MSGIPHPKEVTSRPSVARPRQNNIDGEIQAAFRDFRESAVRLAERVTDLRGVPEDPIAAAQADLRLLRTVFSKWSPDVLVALHAVPSIGFEELRRSLPGISPRVLSLKLKELEQNGLVRREILDTRPPRVRYTLKDRGWTVAWLAQPVLLFLSYSEPPRAAAPAVPDTNESDQ
jgi:DNA-binding HxlR family transcriptional regulator